MRSFRKVSMNGMPTSVECSVRASTLLSIARRVINTCMAWAVATVAHHTKINRAIFAQGTVFHPKNLTFVDAKWFKLELFSCRQLLLCRVTLGKSFLQFSAMKMAHSPPGQYYQRFTTIEMFENNLFNCDLLI